MPIETESTHGVDLQTADPCLELSERGGSVAVETVVAPPDVGLPEQWLLPPPRQLPRHNDGEAQRAALRALVQRLERQGGDDQETANALARLARLARTSKSDYGEAIDVAVRALELRFDPVLRDETVELQAKCGNFQAAADLMVLGQATTALDAPSRRKLASLSYRSGDAGRASVQLAEVARVESEATDALGSLGTLAHWAPDQVSRERGILAWHEAARRHRTKGAPLLAFEATLRAFELDPASPLAAERLAHELEAQGRREAADEVWRQSADAAHDTTRHDLRATAALQSGDIMAAFAALLDGRADANFDERSILHGVEQLLSPRSGLSQGFDMVLAELGCADWLSVRLELGPLLERWTDEASAHVALARLEDGYFAHADQAREANVRALVAEPTHSEARARLTGIGGGDDGPEMLYRALVQSARTAQGGVVARQLATELFERCSRDHGPASLALWALERLRHSVISAEERGQMLSTWKRQAAQEHAEIVSLSGALGSSSGGELEALLRKLEAKLSLEPNEAIEHLAVVQRLLELRPDDSVLRSRFIELIDVVASLVISPSRDGRIAGALSAAPRLLGERGCIVQARLLLRHGQVEPALVALRPLLSEPNTSVRGLLWVLTLARRFRDLPTAARAAERLAKSFRPAVRAVLEVFAAQLYVEAAEPNEAVRLIGGALRTSQNVARLVTLQVALADTVGLDVNVEDLDRALSRVMPNATLCRVMAKTYRQVDDFELALVWAQRAVSLRPGDIELRREALGLALALGQAERVIELLHDLITQALPVSGWDELAASALAWLASAAKDQALSVAHVLLDTAGPSNRSLRAALLNTARVAGDEEFALEILERAAASRACQSELPELLVALSERYFQRGDLTQCLNSALRAARCGAPVAAWSGFVTIDSSLLSADAALSKLELRRLVALSGDDRQALNATTLELAIARFDKANDTDGAVSLWVEYAQQPDSGGWPVAVRDMVEVLGPQTLLSRLDALCRFGVHGEQRSLLLVLVAQVCQEAGDVGQATTLIEAALKANPCCAFVLPLAERLLAQETEPGRLESVYSTVDAAVLGIYGVRALHHRAARGFLARSQCQSALAHAVTAFETCPQHDSSFLLLVELAKRAAEPQAIAAAVMRVAEAESDQNRKVQWLGRAYDVLSDDPEQLRLKFDLAIRILVGCPRVSAVHAVKACLSALSRAEVEELEFLRLRFARALESLTSDLEGPDGARLGIAIAETAIAELGRIDLAVAAFLGALQADADVDEFGALRQSIVSWFRLSRDTMEQMLGRTMEWIERPYVAIGWPAIDLLASISALLSDSAYLLRLESRTLSLGHKPWLSSWLFDEHDELWSEVEDARVVCLDVAKAWLEAGDALGALGLLEHGAKLSTLRSSAERETSPRADLSWHDWQEAYCSCSEQTLPVLGVRVLRERLQQLEAWVPTVIVAETRVRLERSTGDARALSSALAEFSFCGAGSAQYRSDLLVEAAQIVERLGDLEGAIVYFRASLGTYRGSVSAKLGLVSALYRVGRYTTREQAEMLLEVTHGLVESAPDEEQDLVAYVRAEALDSLGRSTESRQLLAEVEGRLGPRTFVALGLAERAMREYDYTTALEYFSAVSGGSLRGIRRLPDVSLLAAKAAASAGDVTLALNWLEPCLSDEQTRPEAVTLQAELFGAVDAVEAEVGAAETAEAEARTAQLVLEGSFRESSTATGGGIESPPSRASTTRGDTDVGAAAAVALAKITLAKVQSLDVSSGERSVRFVAPLPSSPLAELGNVALGTSDDVDADTVVVEVNPIPSSAYSRRFAGGASGAQRQPSELASAGVDETDGAGAAHEAPAEAIGEPLQESGFDVVPGATEELVEVPLQESGFDVVPGAFAQPSDTESREGSGSIALELPEPQGGVSGATDTGVAAALPTPIRSLPAEPGGERSTVEVVVPNRYVGVDGLPLLQAAEPSAYEFAIAVAEELKLDPERQRAWLPDGRRWLRQWPTQLRLLELVRSATGVEGNLSHFQALGQAIALLRGETELPAAPDLMEQPVDVDAVRALLLRDLGSAGAEALELIWDGAEHEFLREPSEYDVTGLMRVVGTASPLSRIYSEAARRLGLTRVALFHRRTLQPGRIQVLLLNPTALLIDGEPAADEGVLGYRIGSALWATLPAHSLLFGLESNAVRNVLKALVLAFGTGEGQPNPTFGESLRLAQVLWQTVRSRSQRRLKEICRSDLVYEESWQKASQSLRRAGLYVAGDLRTALRVTVEDAGLEHVGTDSASLLEEALRLPEAMDLFRFATSAEYAAVRWQPARSNQPGGGTRPW